MNADKRNLQDIFSDIAKAASPMSQEGELFLTHSSYRDIRNAQYEQLKEFDEHWLDIEGHVLGNYLGCLSALSKNAAKYGEELSSIGILDKGKMNKINDLLSCCNIIPRGADEPELRVPPEAGYLKVNRFLSLFREALNNRHNAGCGGEEMFEKGKQVANLIEKMCNDIKPLGIELQQKLATMPQRGDIELQ